ncbi:hypothetical protein GCM10010468_44250 [Actinocorallia longicatena]|uniref:Uncharacterized protein n=1 Tax=Actinocorallia longicatena TaxID=111803 RepID=A0ABP6QDM3_9ACTN
MSSLPRGRLPTTSAPGEAEGEGGEEVGVGRSGADGPEQPATSRAAMAISESRLIPAPYRTSDIWNEVFRSDRIVTHPRVKEPA